MGGQKYKTFANFKINQQLKKQRILLLGRYAITQLHKNHVLNMVRMREHIHRLNLGNFIPLR